MSKTGQQTPPGWYPDPDNTQLRLWDGELWTDQTKPATLPSTPVSAIGMGLATQEQSATVKRPRSNPVVMIALIVMGLIIAGLTTFIAVDKGLGAGAQEEDVPAVVQLEDRPDDGGAPGGIEAPGGVEDPGGVEAPGGVVDRVDASVSMVTYDDSFLSFAYDENQFFLEGPWQEYGGFRLRSLRLGTVEILKGNFNWDPMPPDIFTADDYLAHVLSQYPYGAPIYTKITIDGHDAVLTQHADMDTQSIIIINPRTRDYYTFSTLPNPGGSDWNLCQEVIDTIKIHS